MTTIIEPIRNLLAFIEAIVNYIIIFNKFSDNNV